MWTSMWPHLTSTEHAFENSSLHTHAHTNSHTYVDRKSHTWGSSHGLLSFKLFSSTLFSHVCIFRVYVCVTVAIVCAGLRCLMRGLTYGVSCGQSAEVSWAREARRDEREAKQVQVQCGWRGGGFHEALEVCLILNHNNTLPLVGLRRNQFKWNAPFSSSNTKRLSLAWSIGSSNLNEKIACLSLPSRVTHRKVWIWHVVCQHLPSTSPSEKWIMFDLFHADLKLSGIFVVELRQRNCSAKIRQSYCNQISFDYLLEMWAAVTVILLPLRQTFLVSYKEVACQVNAKICRSRRLFVKRGEQI